MTVPPVWSKRRLRLPKGLVLHFANVPKAAMTWLGPVPITTPLRAVIDCTLDHVAEDFVPAPVRSRTPMRSFDRLRSMLSRAIATGMPRTSISRAGGIIRSPAEIGRWPVRKAGSPLPMPQHFAAWAFASCSSSSTARKPRRSEKRSRSFREWDSKSRFTRGNDEREEPLRLHGSAFGRDAHQD